MVVPANRPPVRKRGQRRLPAVRRLLDLLALPGDGDPCGVHLAVWREPGISQACLPLLRPGLAYDGILHRPHTPR